MAATTFATTFKICKKFKFDWNPLKLVTQHKDMYMHQKNYKNTKFSPCHFWRKFGQSPCTIVQGLLLNFGATLKICKKSNCDRNYLKLSTQHKNMYMYQEKNIKTEKSLVAIFGKIWPKSLYYSTGTFARFWSNFKNL